MTPLDRAQLEILKLKERMEDLAAENEELKRQALGRRDEEERDMIAATEARAMQALFTVEKPMTRWSLLDAIYFDRHSDLQPDSKILDVLMSKCRKKMRSKEALKNVWGRGYEMTDIGRKLISHRLGEIEARRAA